MFFKVYLLYSETTTNRPENEKMAKEIAKAFYELQAQGKCLDESFAATAAQFRITEDAVVDALNKAALASK